MRTPAPISFGSAFPRLSHMIPLLLLSQHARRRRSFVPPLIPKHFLLAKHRVGSKRPSSSSSAMAEKESPPKKVKASPASPKPAPPRRSAPAKSAVESVDLGDDDDDDDDEEEDYDSEEDDDEFDGPLRPSPFPPPPVPPSRATPLKSASKSAGAAAASPYLARTPPGSVSSVRVAVASTGVKRTSMSGSRGGNTSFSPYSDAFASPSSPSSHQTPSRSGLSTPDIGSAASPALPSKLVFDDSADASSSSSSSSSRWSSVGGGAVSVREASLVLLSAFAVAVITTYEAGEANHLLIGGVGEGGVSQSVHMLDDVPSYVREHAGAIMQK